MKEKTIVRIDLMIMKTAYPQPDFARADWYNLNGTWDFSFAPEGETLMSPAYDESIEVPYPWGSPLSGVACGDNGTGYYPEPSHGIHPRPVSFCASVQSTIPAP